MNIFNKIIFKFLNFFLKKNFDKKNYMIGNSHILNMRKNYDDIKNLEELDYKIFLKMEKMEYLTIYSIKAK